MAKGKVTQRDIARLAGVSQATVSVVLNAARESTVRVPEETRTKVLSVIAETGYVADPVAQRMAKGRNLILAVFTYEPAFPLEQQNFFAPFLFGIEQAAQGAGYDLLLMTGASRKADGRKRIFDTGNRLRLADGCVILGREFDRSELARLVAEGFPFVAIGRRDDAGGPVPYVGADYAVATGALVDLAIERGHRRFAYVGPTDDVEASRDRWRGFRAHTGGVATMVCHVAHTGRSGEDLLAKLRTAGATVAFLTERADAIELHRAAAAAGVHVPRDLSIVVLGSHNRSARTGVKFTTYAIPREEMGHRATNALIAVLNGEPGPQILLPCQIEPGETLADLGPGKDLP